MVKKERKRKRKTLEEKRNESTLIFQQINVKNACVEMRDVNGCFVIWTMLILSWKNLGWKYLRESTKTEKSLKIWKLKKKIYIL